MRRLNDPKKKKKKTDNFRLAQSKTVLRYVFTCMCAVRLTHRFFINRYLLETIIDNVNDGKKKKTIYTGQL